MTRASGTALCRSSILVCSVVPYCQSTTRGIFRGSPCWPNSRNALKPVNQGDEEKRSDETEEQERKAAPAPDFTKDGGYALEIPSYVPLSAVTEQAQEIVEEYGVLAKELRIAPDAAQQLLETYADASLALPQGLISGFNPHATTAILRSLWGTEYEANLKVVVDTAKSLGPTFCAWA